MESFLDILPELLKDQNGLIYAAGLFFIGLMMFMGKRMAGRFSDDFYELIKHKLFGGGDKKKKNPPPAPTPSSRPVSEEQTGVGGETSPDKDFTIKTARQTYSLHSGLIRGELATFYVGEYSQENKKFPVVAKIARQRGDNDLIHNEIRLIKILRENSEQYGKHLPEFLDQFHISGGQAGSIFRRLEGYDLRSIREKFPGGVPPEHVRWIFRRCLSVLGYVHSRGIIHANLDPSHIFVRPGDHNVWLLNWCYGIYKPGQTGEKFRVVNEKFSPPEVGQLKPPLPSSDLYALGKTMLYLLGGDVANNTFPPGVPEKFQRFIRYFVRDSPLQRAQDAWKMYAELDELRQEVWGDHKFIEFKV